VRPDGEADIVAQGPGQSLMYYWAKPGTGWSSAQVAGPGTTGYAPSIFVRPDGEADIVAQGPGDSLMYYWAWPGFGWSSAQIAGPGTTFSAPSIFVRPDGEADIVASGASGSLLYYWATPGSAWKSAQIAGTGTVGNQTPSIFVRPDGEADVVASSTAGSLMYYWAMPGSGWSSAQIAGPGTTFLAPSIFVRPDGEADIIAQENGPTLVYYWASPGSVWSSAKVPGIPSPPLPGSPVIADGVATYDSGILTSNLPLQGSVHVVFDEKGDFTFTCHAHDSGFDNIDYAVAAVILTKSGMAFTFQHLGGVEGTSAGLPFGTPRRDDAYTGPGVNAEIANEWPSIDGSAMTASINGQDALVNGIEGEFTKLLDSLLQELGKAAAAAVIALL
jgi:hypothetical protein